METKSFLLGVVVVLALNVAVSLLFHQFFTAPKRFQMKDYPIANANSIKDLIKTENFRRNLHELTRKPHVAGTKNNLEVAEFIRNEMRNQGLENVHFNEYDALLSYPNWNTPNTVEILDEDGETVFRTKGRSPAIIEEEQNDPSAEIQWFAYSANGVAEGDIVYVNTASKQDFEHLEAMGIELKGKIFLARHSGTYRGNIAQMAERKGAKGCLIYSDPVQVASWGTLPNQTFGHTDKMPPNAVQRGTLFVGLGDPRTPAFPSIKGLFKENDEEQLFNEKRIPTIPVLPIPYSDAQKLFENMRGEAVIPKFQGKLNVTYRYGPGLVNNQTLRMTVHSKKEERTIRNVLGYIKGHSTQLVILSNHYDAWTYGAVDPNSGTSVLLEVSRVLKAYQNATGWVPARSILFAHWDAEEYGFMGSTEFAEDYRVQLMRRAVALINMDLIGGNQTLLAFANPTVVNVLRDAAKNVVHPNELEQKEGRRTLYDSWKHFVPSRTNRSTHPHYGVPAGGSDHTAFFDYLGVPIIMFITSSLDAHPTYPLYHTIYETPYLIENILDPKFEMHRAMSEMFIEMVLKFTESDVLPYNLHEFMDDVRFDYLPALSERFSRAKAENVSEKYLKPAMGQFEFLQITVEDLWTRCHQRKTGKLTSFSITENIELNNRLIEFEKCFINPRGVLGNPSARHVLYHPSSDDWYKGGVMFQVHDLISQILMRNDEDKLKEYSKQLAIELSHVNFAFICARHSLDELPIS